MDKHKPLTIEERDEFRRQLTKGGSVVFPRPLGDLLDELDAKDAEIAALKASWDPDGWIFQRDAACAWANAWHRAARKWRAKDIEGAKLADASIRSLLVERDEARAERDRLALDALCALSGARIVTPQEGFVRAPTELKYCIHALRDDRDFHKKDRIAWYETALRFAEDDKRQKVRIVKLEAALRWYADSSNWKDAVEVWGYGQGQHKAIVAPAKLDVGERAREALDESEKGAEG